MIALTKADQNSVSETKSISTAKPIIFVHEDQYISNRMIVESRLMSLLGKNQRVYARETTVSVITVKELEEFLSVNHLNVVTKGKFCYGLFKNNKLLAVAAFGRSCPIQHKGITYRSHELIRFCSLLNLTVVGGLSKLIHYFETIVKPEHIMTYVDREWSEGKSYKKIGFEVAEITAGKEFWLEPVGNKRFYTKDLPKNRTRIQLEKKGWRLIHNLGNIKLAKFLK